jgi:hypothetical protein
VLHASSGNIFVVGMNSGGFLYSRCIAPDNSVSSAVLLPTGTWPQTGGKLGIDADTLYFGAEWYDNPPMEVKLMTCVGTISGTTVTWSGTLSSVLDNSSTPPGEGYDENRYRNGAFVGPSGADTDGTHLVIPSWINNGGVAITFQLIYSRVRKFTSTGTTINTGSGTTLYGEENTFFEVCAARLPNGNIGICFSATDNLLGGRNSVVDDRMIYMELQGAGAGPISANRWYAI